MLLANVSLNTNYLKAKDAYAKLFGSWNLIEIRKKKKKVIQK